MNDILPESRENILGLRLGGVFSARDYQESLAPRLKRFLQEQGRVRFLFYLA